MRKIVSQIRPDRQTLCWSATWPREVQTIARDFCQNEPIQVFVGSLDIKASHHIVQIVSTPTDLCGREGARGASSSRPEPRRGRSPFGPRIPAAL